MCRQWLHFRILMRKIRLETTLAETLFPSTTWTLKRWALEENLEGINLSSRHKYDPQAHKHKVTNYNAMVRILFTTSDTLEHFFPYMFFFTVIEGHKIQSYSHIRKPAHISEIFQTCFMLTFCPRNLMFSSVFMFYSFFHICMFSRVTLCRAGFWRRKSVWRRCGRRDCLDGRTSLKTLKRRKDILIFGTRRHILTFYHVCSVHTLQATISTANNPLSGTSIQMNRSNWKTDFSLE